MPVPVQDVSVVIPDVSLEVIPDVSLEVIQDVSSEVIQDVSSEVIQDVSSEVIQDVSSSVVVQDVSLSVVAQDVSSSEVAQVDEPCPIDLSGMDQIIEKIDEVLRETPVMHSEDHTIENAIAKLWVPSRPGVVATGSPMSRATTRG
jgi:hypothetical protein